MTEEIKPKRKLKSIDFSSEDSHIALVHKDQGGPANGADYRLVLKATSQKPLQISDEFIKKASQVKVTLSITDYLQKFYGLWYEDAEALARVLGFTTVEQEYKAANPNSSDTWYEDYITEKVESVEIMKSLYQAENMADVLAELDGPSYLKLVQDQAMLEKSFRKIERISKAAPKESKPQGTDTSKSNEVKEGVSNNPVVKQVNKENKNMDEIVELQKSLATQTEMLQKALDQIKTFEAEKKEAIAKSRKAEIVSAVKDEGKSEVLFKALKDSNDEDFTAVVKALKEISAAVEKSELFVEKGVQVEEKSKPEVNHVEALLKAKYAAK